MKRTVQTLNVVICVLLLSSYIPKKKQVPAKDPVYIVAIAWEQAKSGGKNQPLVTNVFYFDCEMNYGKVESQLKTFYDAFYKKNRNTMYIKDELEFSYDTKAAAESKRRELIAKFNNNGNEVVLIEKFSVLCD